MSVLGRHTLRAWQRDDGGRNDKDLYPSTDPAGATDATVSVAATLPVTAGAHNAFFVGERYSGDCTLEVINPTLTILTPQGPSFTSFLPLVVR